MANRTVKDAATVKGTNPQYLIEKIIRTRIYESKFWKEECFALSAELLVDKAMELKYLGGVYAGNVKVSPFLCLILKMLQIQPEKDIIVEFITQPDFKYVRALGALYMRLTGTSLDCYKYLEPLYLDYRKLKRMDRNGLFDLVHMDEYVDELLREERILDIILPRIQKRHVLEEMNQLETRVSALMDDGDVDVSDDDVDMKENDHYQNKNDTNNNNSNSNNTNDVINNHRNNNNNNNSNNERSHRSRSGSKHRRNSSRSPAHKRRRSHSKERESRREKDRDREKERGEKDKEREREKKNREKEREKEREKKDREKDRERNRHKERRRSRSREKRHRRNDDDDNDGYHKSKRR